MREATSPFRVILQYVFLDIFMFREEISQITLDIRIYKRKANVFLPPHKKVFHSIYLVYVIEECISFHLVYRLLLMRIVLGWAIFYHKSPELFAWQCFGQMAVEWRRMLLCHITARRSQKTTSAYFASKQMLHFRLADHISPARLRLFLVQETSKVRGRYKQERGE